MAEKGKMKSEFSEQMYIDESTGEKATINHVENSAPSYWDNKHVIGAQRNIDSSASFTTQDQVKLRPGCMKRLWMHYKKYWKLYTALTIVLLAIGLPILFLVIFPAIAQRLVDNAKLPIISASIMNPTPNSVEYSMVATLNVPGGVAVDLKPLNLSLYTADLGPSVPYIKVSLPEYHLKGKTTIRIVNQTAEILDEPQFEKFLASAVNSLNFTMSAGGSTAAYLGVLKAKITLKKNVELAGLNSLNGFDFISAALVFPPLADGTNLQGTVILPNPSIVTFEMGNVTLNMFMGGINIGQGRIDNVLLRPGNNTVALTATANLAAIVGNLGSILSSQSTALQKGNIEIQASGNSTIYNGLHIPYYENVLNNLTISGQVPIVTILLDSVQQFLGSSFGTSITGLLQNLNITSIIDDLTGAGGSGGLGSLTGLLSGLANSTGSSNSTSGLSGLLSSLGLRSIVTPELTRAILETRSYDPTRTSPAGLSIDGLLQGWLKLTSANTKREYDSSRISPAGLSLDNLLQGWQKLTTVHTRSDTILSTVVRSTLGRRSYDTSRTSPSGLSLDALFQGLAKLKFAHARS